MSPIYVRVSLPDTFRRVRFSRAILILNSFAKLLQAHCPRSLKRIPGNDSNSDRFFRIFEKIRTNLRNFSERPLATVSRFSNVRSPECCIPVQFQPNCKVVCFMLSLYSDNVPNDH